jgi:NADPH-dependent curcumin reductase CurA
MPQDRRVVLKRRPAGKPVPDDFAHYAVPVASPGEGEFTVRNRFISLDPGLRQRLSQVDSYVKLIGIVEPLTTTTLGQVVASNRADYSIGDDVVGFHTIAEYGTSAPGPLTRKGDLSATASPLNHWSVLGPTGLTTYFGLLEIRQPKAVEAVLVSAAGRRIPPLFEEAVSYCLRLGLRWSPRAQVRLVSTSRSSVHTRATSTRCCARGTT